MIADAPQRAPAKRRRIWPFGSAPIHDSQLQPLGFVQISLAPGVTGSLPGLARLQNVVVPADADRFVLNVEGYPIRYLDGGDQVQSGYGELYPASSFFFRAVDPRMVQLAAESTNGGNAKVNISFYKPSK